MDSNRNWLIECAIVAVIVALAVGAICILYCLAHNPCDFCAYRVADWVWVLLQYGLAGAFGGFLTYLARFHLQGQDDPPANPSEKPASPRSFNAMTVFVYCMGGVGGSYAILFFLTQSDKSTEIKMDSVTILKNIVTGIVAGFLGFPLLLRISESAEGLLGKAKAAGGEAGARAAQAVTKGLDNKTTALQKTIDMLRWLQHAIRVALDLFDDLEAHKEVDPKRVQSIRGQLEDARQTFPEDRIAAIVLANLYMYEEDYLKSVEIVSETLAVIEPQAQEQDETSRRIAIKNIADLLWNRANYLALLARKGDVAQRDSYKERMYADLERSLELASENVNDIEDPDDPQFGELVKEDRFAKLIAKYKKPAAANLVRQPVPE
jgi:hypothetical protein